MSCAWKIDIGQIDSESQTVFVDLGQSRRVDEDAYAKAITHFAALHCAANAGPTEDNSFAHVDKGAFHLAQFNVYLDKFKLAVYAKCPPVRRNAEAFFLLQDSATKLYQRIVGGWDQRQQKNFNRGPLLRP